jgi:hypothetical protein
MLYSLVIDVARNEPYAIVFSDGKNEKVYGINKHSKKWAASVNLEKTKTVAPHGMTITEKKTADLEVVNKFLEAFGIDEEKSIVGSSNRRLERRAKSLSTSQDIEVKYPGEFIFGVARNILRRKRRRRRRFKSETMVYPVLAVKQKRLFQGLYLDSLIMEQNNGK